jgi:prevent-host-death family protein
MKMNATEFKAKCLAVLDRVHARRESVTITKRGRVVAKLVPDDEKVEQPWLRLRARPATWHGDPYAPVVRDEDIQALK